MNELQVTVTAEDIKKARAEAWSRLAHKCCPIAQALQRMFPGLEVSVYAEKCFVGTQCYATDTMARYLVLAFDDGRVINPTTVTLVKF